MGIGWNLGNSLDAPKGETDWGNPVVNEALLDAVAAAGFGAVRVPVTWTLHLGPGPDFTIEPAWLQRVQEIVTWVLDRGMYAIVNIHHDGADGFEQVEWLTLNDDSGAVTDANNARVQAQYLQIWGQIATAFADFGPGLLYESLNEIHDGYAPPPSVYYDIINNLNQEFVNLVRASGGNNPQRTLVVPGYNTNIGYTLEGFKTPADPTANRLILSAHFYDPYTFALTGETTAWGAGSPGIDNWGQEDHVVSQFQQLKSRYGDAGLPVILGEYGATGVSGSENYRRYYMEYVTKAAHDRGIAPFYWDNGGQGSGADKFGLFDRNTGAVTTPDILAAMIKAVTMPYALDAVPKP